MSDDPSAAIATGAAPSDSAAGWFGKLPALGDFAARRLPQEFVTRWDAWLCERLAASQARLGERWLSLYLTCPAWRFIAMPDAINPQSSDCWTGVLVASVDRVGRYFPLTVAAALPALPSSGAEASDIWRWLAAIEAAAIAALEFDLSIEQFDAELAALPVPSPVPRSAEDVTLSEPCLVPSTDALVQTLGIAIAPLWQAAMRGMSLWTCVPPRAIGAPDDVVAQSAFTIWPSRGLPDDELFTTILLEHAS